MTAWNPACSGRRDRAPGAPHPCMNSSRQAPPLLQCPARSSASERPDGQSLLDSLAMSTERDTFGAIRFAGSARTESQGVGSSTFGAARAQPGVLALPRGRPGLLLRPASRRNLACCHSPSHDVSRPSRRIPRGLSAAEHGEPWVGRWPSNQHRATSDGLAGGGPASSIGRVDGRTTSDQARGTQPSTSIPSRISLRMRASSWCLG
jgi:hypothetical protein